MTARRALALLAALGALAAMPAPARADGDPASDTLLYADAFYPYAPNAVSKPLQKALGAMLAAARRQRFHLRVAIIASSGDLGAYPNLITEPQTYANLLTKEISFNSKPRVLVVLPAGIGGNNLGDDAGRALEGVQPPTDPSADQLARTAMLAVARLAQANHTPVATPKVVVTATQRRAAKKGSTSPLVYILPAGLIVLAAGGAAVYERRRPDDGDAE